MTNNQLTDERLADIYAECEERDPAIVEIRAIVAELQERRKAASEPVVPATLPCSVELKPGLIIGKGCKTETLLVALQRRADYYAELDAMTPEERAEREANIKAFKAMLPQPAPVVREECPAEVRYFSLPGYVMVPKEPTEAMINAWLSEVANWRGHVAGYKAMLAAALHDTPALNSVQSVVTVSDTWIPVSERMPDDEQEVLTINKMGHRFVSFFDKHSGLFFDKLDAPAACCIEHVLVTHWMPLPAAPQEVK
ncbi:DUF551 domain-containing protein [Klebsiella aerogenes]|uniref:DUF551 domain-containing protein n=1 Tax=Klebsiella aerogenes TaxID=548 RepID=UPI002FF5009A